MPRLDAPGGAGAPVGADGGIRRGLVGSALVGLRIGRVRPRIWVPLAAIGAGLVAVVIALPSGGGSQGAEVPIAPGPGVSYADASDESGETAAPSGTGPAPVLAATEAPVGSGTAPAAIPSASSVDGPSPSPTADASAEAAVELIGDRVACFAQLSAGCLDAVDEPASAADTADRAAIAALVSGTGELEPAFVPVHAEEHQRLGDAAMVDLTDAAGARERVLLMLTPGGWRLRAFLPLP